MGLCEKCGEVGEEGITVCPNCGSATDSLESAGLRKLEGTHEPPETSVVW